jgi:thioredoxin-related protein
MKTFIFSTLLFISGSLFSQVQKLTWHTDLEKAIEISTKERKNLMLFFTGSDWCGWCIRLQKEVFYKPEFIEWANKNVILVDIDFPRNKSKQSIELQQQNNLLQQQFGVQGYPTIHFVRPEKIDGRINLSSLGQTGYRAGGPEGWIAEANSYIQAK